MKKIQWNCNQNSKLFVHKNASENIICEMATTLSSFIICYHVKLQSAVFVQTINESQVVTIGFIGQISCMDRLSIITGDIKGIEIVLSIKASNICVSGGDTVLYIWMHNVCTVEFELLLSPVWDLDIRLWGTNILHFIADISFGNSMLLSHWLPL